MKFGAAILSTLLAAARVADGAAAAGHKPFHLRGEEVAGPVALGMEQGVFEAQLGQAKVLERLFGALLPSFPEVTLQILDGGVNIQTWDSLNMLMVAVRLDGNGFERFRADQRLDMGVDVAKIVKVFECAGDDDAVTLHDNDDKLDLVFKSPDQKRSATFSVQLKDLESENLGIPEYEHNTCTVSMPSREFQRIIEHLFVLGETLLLSCVEEGVTFGVNGEGVDGNVMIQKEEDQVKIETQEDIAQAFELGYLNNFTNASSLGPTVTLKMNLEGALAVEYRIEDWGYIKYYLAPKIGPEYQY